MELKVSLNHNRNIELNIKYENARFKFYFIIK